MTHEEIKILISAYTDGEVTPSEKTIVEEHLSSCPACQKDYKTYMAMSSSLSKWSDETLSPDEEIKVQKHLEQRREPMFTKRTMIITSTLCLALIVGSWELVQFKRHFTNSINFASLPSSGVMKYSAAEGHAIQLALNRGVQGRIRSAADDIGDQYNVRSVFHPMTKPMLPRPMLAATAYQPYYMSSNYTGGAMAIENKRLASGLVGENSNAYRVRSGAEFFNGANYGYGIDQTWISPQPVVPVQPYPVQEEASNTEEYDHFQENGFLGVKENPLSTFSIDVDTASYSNIRRFLMLNQLPPKDAVHIEEMINYFHYDYPQPSWNSPFSITTEMTPCPWNRSHNLVLIGLQGKKIAMENLPPSNLVLLVDVSGSMGEENKLPLVKSALHLLVEQLRPQDTVSIAVFSGSATRLLEATSGRDKDKIEGAIDSLEAGGSTNGEDGLELAYKIAKENFKPNGNNRIIVTTDGDFNVGTSNDGDLIQMIEQKRQEGTYLTVLGFGMGNLKASRMEKLADTGNGSYAYIDSLDEARKVLVQQLGGTIDAIAKDVKVQVEFNPAQVKAYRLVGYEKRMLMKEDFNNNRKGTGTLGSNHTVTALYEIVPAGSKESFSNVDDLKYQTPVTISSSVSDEVMTVKLRYQDPRSTGDKSKLIVKTVKKDDLTAPGSENLRFAAAVVEFGMLLRDSDYKGNTSYLKVINEAQLATGDDPNGQHAEFFDLVQRAGLLQLPVKQTPVAPNPDNNNIIKSPDTNTYGPVAFKANFLPCDRDNCGNFYQNVATLSMDKGEAVVYSNGQVRLNLTGVRYIDTGLPAGNKTFQVYQGMFGPGRYNGSLMGWVTTDMQGNFSGLINNYQGMPYVCDPNTIAYKQITLKDSNARSEFYTEPAQNSLPNEIPSSISRCNTNMQQLLGCSGQVVGGQVPEPSPQACATYCSNWPEATCAQWYNNTFCNCSDGYVVSNPNPLAGGEQYSSSCSVSR